MENNQAVLWKAAFQDGRESTVEDIFEWLMDWDDEIPVHELRDFLEYLVSWQGEDTGEGLDDLIEDWE